MKSLWISLLCSFAWVPASGQERPPSLLVQSAQCLAAKEFLVRDARANFEFGYWIDTQSYPGQPVLYVIDFLRTDGREGAVFTIFADEKHGRPNFDIQNNGKFKISASGKSVDFPEEILGGIWTHKQVTAAIKRIERQPRLSISRDVVFSRSDDSSCHSYADREAAR
jgi:hypothetical protein